MHRHAAERELQIESERVTGHECNESVELATGASIGTEDLQIEDADGELREAKAERISEVASEGELVVHWKEREGHIFLVDP